MEDKEQDIFKEAINKKFAEVKMSSDRDKLIWEKVMSEINAGKTATIQPHYTWYAIAASIIILLTVGLGIVFLGKDKNLHSSTHSVKETIKHSDHTNNNPVINTKKLEEKLTPNNHSHHHKIADNKNTDTPIPAYDEVKTENQIILRRLKDNSLISLNAGAVLKTSKKFKNQRSVILEGEAFFEIQSDKKHPFIVSFDEYKLVVVGTKFNVKNTNNNPIKEITVTEGIVRVFDNIHKDGILVKKGEHLVIEKNKISILTKTDTNQAVAWKTHLLNFTNEKLNRVVSLLENQHGKKINLDDKLNNCRFTGDISGMSLEDALQIVTSSASLELNIDKESYNLTGSGCD